MKTIIFSGSPRENGDTAYLINVLTENLTGEYMIVDCYRDDISPCVDCRACRERSGCVINDGMQKIYDYIRDCDNVVIATPIYFSQPTGKLLDVWSRFQTYFSASHFRHECNALKPKRGVVILVGGGSGGAQSAMETATALLRSVNSLENTLIGSLNTDVISARDDIKAIDKTVLAAKSLNDDHR